MRKFTSLGMLLIVAIAAVSGIFLLDLFYLQPHVENQKWVDLQERVASIEHAVQAGLASEKEALVNVAAASAGNPEMARLLREGSSEASLAGIAKSSFGPADVALACLTDPSGRIVSSWSKKHGDDQTAAVQNASQVVLDGETASGHKPERRSGIVALGGGAGVYATIPIPDSQALGALERAAGQTLGRLWLVLRIDKPLLAKIGAGIDANLVFIPGKNLPGGPVPGSSVAQPFWVSGNSDLMTAWPVHDLQGQMLGYFRAEIPGASVFRQAATARRIILIVVSLSLGLTVLVIAWMHILVTGPVVRLLRQIARVQDGKNAPEGLANGLHGEPLVLAKHLQTAFEQLATLAKTDQLTGLANRRQFEQILSAFYHQAQRYNRPLSLIAIDIDFFKAINDTWGHQAGDEVLKQTARVLASACRQADIPARIGGDEFCVILPETAADDARKVAERIRAAIAAAVVEIGSTKVGLSASFGVADMSGGQLKSPDALMSLADEALYRSKRSGRNQVSQAPGAQAKELPAPESTTGLASLTKKMVGVDSRFRDVFLGGVEEIMGVMAQHDPYKANHSRHVRQYAHLIAQEMGLSARIIDRLGVAAMLHDIGMMALPDHVLQCPGALDPEQAEIVRQHPLLSAKIMEGLEFLEQEIPAVRHHHERFDGSGYPDGIKGPAIPLTARILAVADSFDAVTSPRVFHDARGREEALREIETGAGTQFDPVVVEAFLAVARRLGDKLMPGHEPASAAAAAPADAAAPAALTA